MAGQGFLAPQPLSCRLLIAACVAGLHALVLGLALWGPLAGQGVGGGRPVSRPASRLMVMVVEPENRPAAPRQVVPRQAAPRQVIRGGRKALLAPVQALAAPPARPAALPGAAAEAWAAVERRVPVLTPAFSAAAAQAAVSPAIKPDPWAAYARALWQKIIAHRPSGLALEGNVVLGFHLDPAGRLTEAHVLQSSGIALLDRQALRALREAGPFPPLPEGGRPSGHDFTLPVNFRL